MVKDMTDDKLIDTICEGICDDAFNRYKKGLKDGSLLTMAWKWCTDRDTYSVRSWEENRKAGYRVEIDIAAIGLLRKEGAAMWLSITVEKRNEDCGIWEEKWVREEELVDEYHEYAREFLYQQSRRV